MPAFQDLSIPLKSSSGRFRSGVKSEDAVAGLPFFYGTISSWFQHGGVIFLRAVHLPCWWQKQESGVALVYAAPFLQAAGRSDVMEVQMQQSQEISAADSQDNCLEWEYTAQVALGIVAFAGTMDSLTEPEKNVVGDFSGYRPQLLIVRLGEDIETLEAAQLYIEVLISREKRTSEAIVVLAFPRFSTFPQFDGIIRFALQLSSTGEGSK